MKFQQLAATVVAIVFSSALATVSQAAVITGDPVPDAFSWTPNSTNALNYANLTPGRVGQNGPYVLFVSNTSNSVALNFYNTGNNGLAFFETRIDGIATGGTAHPVVIGDTIHTGGTSVATGSNPLGKTFTANSYVDIRLALGGERDYDFGWTRFEVAKAASVPDTGGTLAMLGLSMAGIGYVRRRMNAR